VTSKKGREVFSKGGGPFWGEPPLPSKIEELKPPFKNKLKFNEGRPGSFQRRV